MYKQATLLLVEQSRRLEILIRCPRKNNFNAPSWVPDFSQEIQETIPHWWPFRASSFSECQAKYSGDGKLEIIGRRITTVSTVAELELSNHRAMIGYLYDLGIDALQNSQYPTGESYLDAWVWTFLRSMLENEEPFVPKWDVFLTFQQFKDTVISILNGTAIELDESKLARCWEGLWPHARQVFNTLGGYTGTSSHMAQPSMYQTCCGFGSN